MQYQICAIGQDCVSRVCFEYKTTSNSGQSHLLIIPQITMKLVVLCAVALLTVVAAASLSADVVVAQSPESSAAAIGYDWITGAIAGGRDAQRHSAPWIVSIQWGWNAQTTNQHCGGSIITASWVVTAGHCLGGTTNFGAFLMIAGRHNLRLAETTEQRRNINRARTFVHPRYVPGGQVGPFDIALIHAAPAFQLNTYVQVVALPAAGTIPHGQLTLHGWGSTSTTTRPVMPAILQTVTKPSITLALCRTLVPSHLLDNTNLCTGPLSGGVSACGGDSGGPLVQNRVLVGVVSWGVSPCGTRNAPSVYVRTSGFIDWIRETMRR